MFFLYFTEKNKCKKKKKKKKRNKTKKKKNNNEISFKLFTVINIQKNDRVASPESVSQFHLKRS